MPIIAQSVASGKGKILVYFPAGRTSGALGRWDVLRNWLEYGSDALIAIHSDRYGIVTSICWAFPFDEFIINTRICCQQYCFWIIILTFIGIFCYRAWVSRRDSYRYRIRINRYGNILAGRLIGKNICMDFASSVSLNGKTTGWWITVALRSWSPTWKVAISPIKLIFNLVL